MKYRMILTVVALVAVGGTSSRGVQEKSWVGERVMFTKPHNEIQVQDRLDGKIVKFPFSGMVPIKVREQRDGRLRIHDGQREGWVDKADFVLVRDAPAFFTRQIHANPKDTFALYMRGWSFFENGEPDNAIKDFNEYIRLEPRSANAFGARGNAWYEKKQYGKAIQDFDQAIRLNPNQARWFTNRGIVWHTKKNFDKAIKDFNEAIRLDPKLVQAFHNRGAAWSEKKEIDKAIKDYDEAIRLDPKSSQTFCNRGDAWSDKKDFDKAFADYDEAIRLNPKLSQAFNGRGSVWHHRRQFDRAIKDYGEAIRLNPNNAIAFNNRGNAWQAKREHDKAIKDFEKAVRINPKDPFALFGLSVAQMLGQEAQAVHGFRAILDKHGWKKELSAYAAIFGHFAARQATKEAEANQFLKDAKGKLDKTWPYPAIQFLIGEIDEANLLKQATDKDKQTETRCYLGLDHALRGRKKEALAHLRWVKEHGNSSFTEYAIALVELDRLERPDKRSK
jgi:tetratricopeptide (TPR) repeat protein